MSSRRSHQPQYGFAAETQLLQSPPSMAPTAQFRGPAEEGTWNNRFENSRKATVEPTISSSTNRRPPTRTTGAAGSSRQPSSAAAAAVKANRQMAGDRTTGTSSDSANTFRNVEASINLVDIPNFANTQAVPRSASESQQDQPFRGGRAPTQALIVGTRASRNQHPQSVRQPGSAAPTRGMSKTRNTQGLQNLTSQRIAAGPVNPRRGGWGSNFNSNHASQRLAVPSRAPAAPGPSIAPAVQASWKTLLNGPSHLPAEFFHSEGQVPRGGSHFSLASRQPRLDPRKVPVGPRWPSQHYQGPPPPGAVEARYGTGPPDSLPRNARTSMDPRFTGGFEDTIAASAKLAVAKRIRRQRRGAFGHGHNS